MNKNVSYRLEYVILDNSDVPTQIFCYSVSYPPRPMTFSCTIGNSMCCHYCFAVAY